MSERSLTSESLSYDDIEVGKEHGPYEYPLKLRIARHLEAVENEHPWHHARSPWGPPVAPPVILGNAALRFIDSIAPVPPGTLHAKQDIETVSALRQDRRLIGYGAFADKHERRGRRWFVFEARWRDETGLIIGHTRTTMAFPVPPPPAGQQATRNTHQASLPAVTHTIRQETMTAYSEDSANARRGASIHVQAEAAKAAGYATTVAQGLMEADYISEMMTQALGRYWFSDAGLSLTFLRPVLCGDTVIAGGRLREETPEGAVVRRTYEVWCRNQRDETVAAGTASALVPGRP